MSPVINNIGGASARAFGFLLIATPTPTPTITPTNTPTFTVTPTLTPSLTPLNIAFAKVWYYDTCTMEYIDETEDAATDAEFDVLGPYHYTVSP